MKFDLKDFLTLHKALDTLEKQGSILTLPKVKEKLKKDVKSAREALDAVGTY